ncbi:putative Ig domain-containing protein [Desulfovibrio sp.]|uniref:putative Ig domain-containing protein n=1 Tax=Desulfovibrio sp. TaxID=885 RepID=UPI0025BF4456|nr:putative Ig domain-containing protein [Desulfovibrio sp.]
MKTSAGANAVTGHYRLREDWLTFNAKTDTFTGTAPVGASSFGMTVTATDTSGLKATDSFTINVLGAPTVTQTSAETMTVGKSSSFSLPAHTFVDPQGSAMHCIAELASGGALPPWLQFNSTTLTFIGTPPTTVPASLSVEVIAKDTSGLTAADTFTIDMVGAHTTNSVGLVGVSGTTSSTVHG